MTVLSDAWDYLTTGARHRVSPSRLVDPDYYAQQTSLADGEDCVAHYMLGARMDRVSLTPALDARYYTRRVPAALEAKSPLHHLLNTPAELDTSIACSRTGTASAYRPNSFSPQPRW